MTILSESREVKAAAASELLARRKARRNLLGFTQYTMPSFQANWHHVLLCHALDRFIRGEVKRLMVFMPPRHGKSELVSRRLPAMILGINPDANVIAASYGADLASQMNRDVQRIIDSREYGRLFKSTKITGKKNRSQTDSVYLRNNDLFEIIDHSGSYRSVGVGGAATGHGFDYGIIDDPIKNREEANSETYRQKTYEWYTSVFYTRQEKEAGILLTVTRWHEDDLAGRLLMAMENDPEADQWEVVRFPAIAEEHEEYPMSPNDPRDYGEPLWPEKYNSRQLAAIRATLTDYEWGGLYQQRPKAPEGNRFKRHWFEIVDVLPADCRFVRYWDKAGTESGGAYTAGVLMAVAPNRLFFVVDTQRAQLSAMERENLIKQTAQLDRERYGAGVRIYIEQEPGSGGLESADATVRNLAGFAVYKDRPTGDKDTRLLPLEAQSQAGNVKLIKGAWNLGWLNEISAIPNGAYRDQSDASSGAFNMLTGNAPPKIENQSRAKAPMQHDKDVWLRDKDRS